MPKNNPMQRTVSIAPAMYIQVAGGLKPALTKNSRVAGTVIFPMMWGMKNTAHAMRRMLKPSSKLNLSASNIWSPGGFVENCTSRRVSQPCHVLLSFAPLEPGFPLGIKRVEVGTVETRHVTFDLVADFRLQVGKVAIAFRKLGQQRLIELQGCRRIDWIEPVLLVGETAQHNAPFAPAFLKEIVEAASAHDVANDSLDRRPLRDRHLGLHDCALAFDVDAHAAQHVHDADATIVTFLADADEFFV